MKRNFLNESKVNIVLRAVRAAKGRFIGRSLVLLGFFNLGRPKRLYFKTIPWLINSKAMFFGDDVHFGYNSRIECFPVSANKLNDPLLSIGDNTSFGDYLHIGVAGSVTIGKYVLGGSNILLVDHNHGNPRKDLSTKSATPPRLRKINPSGSIIIGDNVWIGDNCVILRGAVIGEGAIIGANSIVKSEVPPFTVYQNSTVAG